MKRLFVFGVMGLAVALVAVTANAQTADQLKCQITASKTVGKFSGSKVKCLNKCWSKFRKGDPSAICTPPGGRDATTQACIDAAEAKSLAGQAKKCGGAACPNCYSGGDCTTDAQSKTDTAENLIDGQEPGVHCQPATADEGKCQDNTGKVLTKWVGSLSKCTQKCKASEAKGKTDGSCDPPATDTKTVACINAGKAKCVAGVDKKCATAGVTPACWTFPSNGTQWCNLVQTIVDGQYGSYFCGSPSGAFLE
jgi:hypothetical protein